MPVLYTNQASSTLASGITNSSTTISVQAGHGARFPAISGGDYFFATLDNNAGTVEIVRVTARSADSMTVVRAQDGTSASSFSAGAVVELRVTKAMLDDLKIDARTGLLSTHVTTALGYTPANRAGDTFTGNVTINTGADSRVLLQSSGTTQGQFQTTGSLVRLASNNALPLVLAVNGVDHFHVLSTGAVGVGTNALTGYGLRVGRGLTGATLAYGVASDGAVQSDVTNNASLFRTLGQTAAAAFTLSAMVHYNASQGTLGAGSAVTNQYGFFVDQSLTGASFNYGFYSNMASGSNRWNLFMNGTASNFLAGNLIVNAPLGFGSSGSPSYGTSGQVLTSSGSGAAPSWSTLAGTPDYVIQSFGII